MTWLVSLYLICISILLHVLIKIYKSQFINHILKIVVIYYITLWLFIPTIITIVNPKISDLFIPLNSYLIFAVVELSFNIIILSLFYIFSKRGDLDQYSEPENNNKYLLICILVLLMYYLYSTFPDRGYLIKNDISKSSLVETTLSPFILLFSSTIYFNIVRLIIFPRKWNVLDVASIFLVFVILQTNIQAGSRIILLMPIFFFSLIIVYSKSNYLKKVIYLIIFTLLLIISLNVIVYVSKNRPQKSKVEITLNAVRNEYSSNSIDVYLKELVIKLNSIQDGAVLVTLSGVNYAGFNPYKGALLAFIPRVIFPDKPVPGSFNNTITGTPARFTAKLKGLNPEISNLGISASGISLWQMGVLGLVLSILVNTINLLIINNLLKLDSILFQIIGFSLLQLPNFILINSGDAIIKNWITTFTVYLIILLTFNLNRIITEFKIRRSF